MINIFTICYHFITNSYSKVKGLVSPGASDVNAHSANDKHSVSSSNEGIDTNRTTNNITIKSIFKNILSFFQGDKNKSAPPTSNTITLECQSLSHDDAIAQLSNAINKYNDKNIERTTKDKLINQALNDLEAIPNDTLETILPEECIKHFISVGLPPDKAKLVTPEIFRSLIAQPGSSVRSVLYTLRTADDALIKKDNIEVFISLYEATLRKNMPYKTFDSDDHRYRVLACKAKTIQQHNYELFRANLTQLQNKLKNEPKENVYNIMDLQCQILELLPDKAINILSPDKIEYLLTGNSDG